MAIRNVREWSELKMLRLKMSGSVDLSYASEESLWITHFGVSLREAGRYHESDEEPQVPTSRSMTTRKWGKSGRARQSVAATHYCDC